MTDPLTDRTWTRRFWTMLGLVTLARLIYLAFFPYDLVGDEAYYWDWGRQLDWGYFSKPPMIAWLMALFDWLGGGSLYGLKLAPILFNIGTTTFLFLLARRLYGARAAFWTAALMLASIGNVAVNALFTIDAPLLFCWTGGLYVFWRILELSKDEHGRAPWAVALVVLLGCGLLSKQMMLAFWGMALGYLLIDAQSRWLLAKPGTWIVALAGLAFLLPPLWWNYQNEWITLVHMQDHFQPGKEAWVEYLVRPLTFIGLQIVLGSVITGVLLFGIVITGALSWGKLDRRARFLLIFTVPGLLTVFFMSFRQNINANWPAVFYPAAYILLGGWGMAALATGRAFDKLRWLFRPGVYLGAFLAVVAYSIPYIVMAGGWEGHKKDPGRRMQGWSEVGEEAGKFYAVFPGGQPPIVIAGGHRHTAAELAFYLPGQPTVHRWFQGRHVESQYEIWEGPDAVGEDALIIWPGNIPQLPADVQLAFDKTERLGDFTVQVDTDNAKPFTVFKGIGFKEWNR